MTIQTKFHWHPDSTFTIERVQDIEPVLKHAKSMKSTASKSWHGDMHYVASVPMVVIERYKKMTGIDLLGADQKTLKRFLNDYDNRCFRTKLGRV